MKKKDVAWKVLFFSKDRIPWRKRFKAYAIESSGGSCCVCGYDKCYEGFAFHHINPKEKKLKLDITAFNSKMDINQLELELKKCALLCHNCHAELHAGLLNLSNDDLFEKMKIRRLEAIEDVSVENFKLAIKGLNGKSSQRYDKIIESSHKKYLKKRKV